ncbi:uncharacterized protein LOC119597485 [Penaeus monodon]|uniref:uncharacterized protein LOC119597485 n=1 Tax=Penaeus monodon TaxID=6687 RepID=UPI0018A6DC69|nr:uncharacterized protein LOC119597485 [Penaeus monodon]
MTPVSQETILKAGKPITEYIRKKYGKTALNTFRRTEKLSFREKKLQKDIRFLKLCKDYRVIPNFVNFRVHNPMFVYTEIYRSWCFQLLNREINRQMRKETATILTEEQKDVLAYGLDYCLPQTKIPFHRFYLYFEKLCNTIKNCDIYNNNFNNVTNNITTIASTFRKFSQQSRQTHDSKDFLSPLQSLQKDNTIIITKPDKGRGVVILNKCDYKQKMMAILNDHTKFKRITAEVSTHLLYLEDKLNRLLRTIKSSISVNTYNLLMTSGSRPGTLYGLPKVHKANIPLRPIISSIGTFNYNVAKFLVPIIAPITTNQYTIDNSTFFAKEITSLNFQQPVIMASFDVESLFTNVPLQETTELITKTLETYSLNKFG